MRVPDLLGLEDPAESQRQASHWTPLAQVQCHPHTVTFLCLLFAPLCHAEPVWPCRSLCEAVRDACLPTMALYGFPWPDMVRCDRFPLDHPMCVSAPSNVSSTCKTCRNLSPQEDLEDIFCRADFALKGKVVSLRRRSARLAKLKVLRRAEHVPRVSLRNLKFRANDLRECCKESLKPSRKVLILGILGENNHIATEATQGPHRKKKNTKLRPEKNNKSKLSRNTTSTASSDGPRSEVILTLLAPWKRSAEFKLILTALKTLNCTTRNVKSRLPRRKKNF